MKEFKTLLTDFKNSKNKIYFLLEKRFLGIAFLVFFTALFSIIGFVQDGQGFWKTLMGLIDIFTLESPNLNSEASFYIILARIFAVLIITFTIFALFLDRFYNKFLIHSISKKPYDIVIGLGKHNRAYLRSVENTKDNIIVMELDANNPYIEQYRKKGFGIVAGNYKNNIINPKNIKNIIISVGSDDRCIDIASYFSYKLKNSDTKIYTHITNRTLYVFFKDKFLANSTVEIIPFSFEENIVKTLWQEYSILGNFEDIVTTDEDINFAIIGDSNLAKEIIYYLINLAHLPHQNRVFIHLVSKKAKRFKKQIHRDFSSLEEIKNIELVPHNVCEKNIDFYTKSLWKEKNLVYIFVADEDEEKNMDTALKLYDITYREDIVDEVLKTDILVSINYFNALTVGFYKKYQNLHTFGYYKKIANKEVLFDLKLDCIGKQIHQKHSLSKKVTWSMLDLSKRESNIFQALHINIKLLSLGLKSKKSNIENVSKLSQNNRAIFNDRLAKLGVNPQKIQKQLEEYKSEYFPNEFKTIVELIAKSEHNRWLAHHFINGWKYNKNRSSKKKHHGFLLPLEEFRGDEKMMLTYQYDLMALFYIPEYLAGCGFEIEVLSIE